MTDASPEARTQAGRDLLDGMDWQMTTGEELQTAILVIEAEAIKPYREALTWFVANTPVTWDDGSAGCRFCGTFDRSGKLHRNGCEFIANALLAEDSDAT